MSRSFYILFIANVAVSTACGMDHVFPYYSLFGAAWCLASFIYHRREEMNYENVLAKLLSETTIHPFSYTVPYVQLVRRYCGFNEFNEEADNDKNVIEMADAFITIGDAYNKPPRPIQRGGREISRD